MKIKGAICILLAVTMCLCVFPVSTSAAGKYYSSAPSVLNSAKLYPQKTGFIQMDNQVEALLSRLRPNCATTAQLVEAAYDWLVNNLSYKLGTYYPYYDYNSRSEIPIPFYVLYFGNCPFTEKTGVCDNFSSAFMIIMRAIGFDAYIRPGKMYTSRQTYDHVWVEVLINGRYYIFDPQVDNTMKTSRGTNSHTYYCCPADEMRSTYVPDQSLSAAYDAATLPVSQKKTAYCYATLRKGGNGTVSGNYTAGKSVQMTARSQHFNRKNYGYKFDGWLAETGCCRIGSSITVTAKPDAGATFKGWYVNEVLKSTSLTYTFTVGSDVKIVGLFSGPQYSDVPAGSWYYNAVYYCNNYAFMSGTGVISFSPEKTLTRAMTVTILSKMSYEATNIYTPGKTFRDVKPTAYYAAAVEWAYSYGITAGVGNGFAPDKPITREELATILYKYAVHKKKSTWSRSDLSAFKDSASVHAWAKDALSWAVSVSLISGYSDKTLGPGKNATRAQAAVIFSKLSQLN